MATKNWPLSERVCGGGNSQQWACLLPSITESRDRKGDFQQEVQVWEGLNEKKKKKKVGQTGGFRIPLRHGALQQTEFICWLRPHSGLVICENALFPSKTQKTWFNIFTSKGGKNMKSPTFLCLLINMYYGGICSVSMNEGPVQLWLKNGLVCGDRMFQTYSVQLRLGAHSYVFFFFFFFFHLCAVPFKRNQTIMQFSRFVVSGLKSHI